MIKFVFGLLLVGSGFFLALFYNPVWGLYLFAALSHIRLTQLGENIALPLQVPMAIACLTLVMYLLSSQYEKKFSKWPAEVWLLGFMVIGMAVGSASVAVRPDVSWQFTFDYAKYWIFFVLLINLIDSQRKVEWFHRILILSAAWLVFRCWDLRGTTGPRFENLGGGNVEDANHFAAALILLFPFVFLKTMHQKWWIKIGAAILCFGIIMAIFISGSRGGMLGLVVLGAFIILGFKEKRKKVLVFSVILGLVTLIFITDYQKDRFQQLFIVSSEEKRDDSAQARVNSWKLALQLFNEHKLTGIGLGNTPYYSGYHVTHNLWLEVLSEGGILVAAPFLVLLYRFFKNTKRTAKQLRLEHREDEARYVITVRIALGAFLICATFLNRLIYEPIYWCIGLGVIHVYLADQRVIHLLRKKA